MNYGAWIHPVEGQSIDQHIARAAEHGLRSARSYHIGYAEQVAPLLKQSGMGLWADMWVDGEALAQDWRSQLQLDELERYHTLGVSLEAICVGNELRQGGNTPEHKQFTARLSFGLANLIAAYREWMTHHGYSTPLTYAMEGIVFDAAGHFHEWLWPLIDACDIIALNSYPMDSKGWFGFGAFDESQRFLRDPRMRRDRLVHFEAGLRRTLQELEHTGKPVAISETGFPSAVGWHREGDGLLVPDSDHARYEECMHELVTLFQRVNDDYQGRIQAIYFYEWWDNLYHHKVMNEEQSPIHIAFGLCDRFGVPKFNIRKLFMPEPQQQ